MAPKVAEAGKKLPSKPLSSPRACKRSPAIPPPSPDLRLKKQQVSFAKKVEAEAASKVQETSYTPQVSPRRAASRAKDVLDLQVRQQKGFPPRRWYLVSWSPCGSRPDSWVDCEDTPKHLVIQFEKLNPMHTATVDAEIKRRKGGRPPRPKAAAAEESQGRRDCTVYEAEDPKKKAYTRCDV
jgi:hypothetical protein